MKGKTKEKSGEIAKAVIYLLLVLVIACTTIFLVMRFTKESEPEITNSFISHKLEAASELTSAKLTYNGFGGDGSFYYKERIFHDLPCGGKGRD